MSQLGSLATDSGEQQLNLKLIQCLSLLLSSSEVTLDVTSSSVGAILNAKPQVRAGCLRVLEEASFRLNNANHVLDRAIHHMGGTQQVKVAPPPPLPQTATTTTASCSTQTGDSYPISVNGTDYQGLFIMDSDTDIELDKTTLEPCSSLQTDEEGSIIYQLMVPVHRHKHASEILATQQTVKFDLRCSLSSSGDIQPASGVKRQLVRALNAAHAVVTAPLRLISFLTGHGGARGDSAAGAGGDHRTSISSGWSFKLYPSYLTHNDVLGMSSLSSSSEGSVVWSESMESSELECV